MGNGGGKDSQCRDAIHMGQLSHRPLQFGRPFDYFHLKLISGLANFFFSLAQGMNQIRAAEGDCRMVCSHGEQHPVRVGWKIAALTTNGYHPGIGVEPNRDNNAAEGFQSVINIVQNDLLPQRLVES